jgi:hypothetical protein
VLSHTAVADGAEVTGTIDLGDLAIIRTVVCPHQCVLTLYCSASDRTADSSRAVGDDPVGNHGIIAEFVMTGGETFRALPGADAFPAVDTVAYRIVNISGATNDIDVTINYARIAG